MSVMERAWYSGAWWLWLLRPIELVFRILVCARRGLFKLGVFSSWRAPCKVIVVGNVTVGGTGKSPVVIALVEHLQAKGVSVGVVSRGYGGAAPTYPYHVRGDSPAEHAGDEPLSIHLRTGAPVVVAPDRVAAARALLQSQGVDVILSDDGLQHYALQRDLEVVLVDGERALGNGFCLPAGPLREPASRLAGADFVLRRGGSKADVRYRAEGLVNLVEGELRAIGVGEFERQPVAVAGIGQPAQFFATLATLGFSCREQVFPDHHRFVPGDFDAMGDAPVIMTEKDAVKCRAYARDNWWYLKINAELPQSLLQAAARLAEIRDL